MLASTGPTVETLTREEQERQIQLNNLDLLNLRSEFDRLILVLEKEPQLRNHSIMATAEIIDSWNVLTQ